MANRPQYPTSMKLGSRQLVLQNTTRNGSTTLNGAAVTGSIAFTASDIVATAGATGTRLDQILVERLGTTPLAVLRFFIGLTSTPTDVKEVYELLCAAVSASETVATAVLDVTLPKNTTETQCAIPYLPVGYSLYVASSQAVAAGPNAFQVTAWGGDL
jgi:hypothetical protein